MEKQQPGCYTWHNLGVVYKRKAPHELQRSGRKPTPLQSAEKQRFLEWLLTPVSERNPRTMQELADELGVERRTLTNWKTTDREFMEAWEARYLATIGSPERKQKLLDVLERTASDPDDPKHVQAIKTYFDIVEGLRPQKMQLEVTRSPVDLPQDVLEALLAEKLDQHREAG